MTEYVRVQLDNGAQTTTSREYAEMVGLKILEQKAATSHDVPREPKYPADLGPAETSAEPNKSGNAPVKSKEDTK